MRDRLHCPASMFALVTRALTSRALNVPAACPGISLPQLRHRRRRAAVVVGVAPGRRPAPRLHAGHVPLLGGRQLLVELLEQEPAQRQVRHQADRGAGHREQRDQARDQPAAQRPPGQPAAQPGALAARRGGQAHGWRAGTGLST